MLDILEHIDSLLSESSYRGPHSAPGPDGAAPLHDLTQNGIYPPDIYGRNAARHYGHGKGRLDQRIMEKIHEVRGRPNEWVKIYRAVPTGDADEIWDEVEELEDQKWQMDKRGEIPGYVDTNMSAEEYYQHITDEIERLTDEAEDADEGGIDQINRGDWVTISYEYAEEHGQSNLGGKYKVLANEARAKNLYTDGNSIYEWGWWF